VKTNKQNNNSKEVLITYGNDDSINVNIFNNKILMEIVGSFDNNLKELEKISGSKIFFRGNSIAIKGDKYANEKVKDAIEYLINRFRIDKKIDKDDIITSLNKEISINYSDDDSININIFNNKILMEIVGEFDKNLKEMERFTGTKIYFRGSSIVIKGKKAENERVKNAIEYLIGRFINEKKMI